MRDGRLRGAERASFERHAKLCPACAREVQELDALAETLRAAPLEQADELRARRERTRLLAALDRELLAPKGDGERVRRRLLWPIAAMTLAASALLVWRISGRSPAHAETSPAVVHADPATAWSERVDGDREVVMLDHGALSIRVDHATNSRRLVVVLPDGQLEDTGTTFRVSADDGRTTRVAVQEGSVVLRLRGQPAIALSAGDVWSPTAPPPAMASACANSTPATERSCVTPARSSAVRSSAQPPRVATSSEVAHDASGDLSGPMAALDRGDNRAAADGFAHFLRIHASDARAEDAAYLRVIALQRCGDRDGMRAAGIEYLHRYPAGFRRAEVETLSKVFP
ncbi:MAG TPA: FecR domain-containing protein [Polyangiaceae bacterium]|nr:FecR domain-containing protein [Polyangiaceae bacterium]